MQKNCGNSCKIAIQGGEAVLGRIVLSTAGRDCGMHFIIVGIEDENHLLLADGRLRMVEKPKKKKLRHVRVLDVQPCELHDKLLCGTPVLNAELRRTLAAYNGCEHKIKEDLRV